MYCIVAFPDEKDSVAVVPWSWILNNGFCLWPPFSKTKLENAVKKAETPTNITAWAQVRARVVKVFDTYDDARKKLSKSTLTSELSDSDDDSIIRKRNPMKRKENSNLGHETNLVALPKPPKLPRTVEPSSSNGSDSTSSQGNSLELERDDESSNIESDAAGVQETAGAASTVPYILEVHSCEKTAESTATILAEIKLKLDLIEAKVDGLQDLQFQRSHNVDDSGFEELPFEDDLKLSEFAAQLKADKDFRSKLVMRWGQLGGKKLSFIVSRMMADLMVDSLGVCYSLKGKRGNKCFESLGFLPIILAAVKKSWKATVVTKSDIEGQVSDWLRHSKGRLDGKAPKKDNNFHRESDQRSLSEDSDL